jgi:hypothetical protein
VTGPEPGTGHVKVIQVDGQLDLLDESGWEPDTVAEAEGVK